MSKAQKGKIVSDETKKIQSEQRIGLPHTNRKRIGMFDLNGNLIQEFDGIVSTVEYGFNRSTISKCLCGRLKTYKTYIWKYLKKE